MDLKHPTKARTMMTRKHFQAVADTIKQIENTKEREKTAHKFVAMFTKENPCFSIHKFLTACEVSW